MALSSDQANAQRVLQEVFGFTAFRGDQEEVVLRTMAGGHSLVIKPTGGGKSLCFQIPAIVARQKKRENGHEGATELPFLTLVLSPLVALMKDQVDSLVERGVDVAFINSLLDRKEREKRYRAVRDGRYDLVYVTPERFRKPDFLEVLQSRRIGILAVDEAHCISEWGHDFRPDYSKLGSIRETLGNPTTIALTATATPDVQRDILKQLGLRGFSDSLDSCQLFHSGIERPNLRLDVAEVWGIDDKLQRITDTLEKWPGMQGIVYFTLIRSLDEMSERLRKMGVAHVCYHGDLPRHRKQSIQDEFMSGGCKLVLATNAFGMGIDKEDIRFVVHAEVPGSMESYYQEIGRAGRDGEESECLLLYDQQDLMTQMEFMRWSNPDAAFYHRVYDFLAHEAVEVRAFGIDWLRERLCDRQRHDRRLETALSMLQRYGVIEDERDLSDVVVNGPLPEPFLDQASMEQKLARDQRKLYAIVEYVRSDNHREFIERYFGAAVDDGDDSDFETDDCDDL